MKRRKLEHCVTTEREGKARKTKGGFGYTSFASDLVSSTVSVHIGWGVSHTLGA